MIYRNDLNDLVQALANIQKINQKELISILKKINKNLDEINKDIKIIETKSSVKKRKKINMNLLQKIKHWKKMKIIKKEVKEFSKKRKNND